MDDHVRRARRAFILQHHPDRGGDPAEFVAGLDMFDRTPAARPVVIVIRRVAWPRRTLVRALRRVARRRPQARVR